MRNGRRPVVDVTRLSFAQIKESPVEVPRSPQFYFRNAPVRHCF